ncbi:KleE stable inheritance protein [Pseudomonas sp. CFBP 13602]|uniref:KleE stable inheritance protein n=1 Tax=Pseudomonas sp. CFBP 13602 TaxID=2774039 RepID=UPI00177ED4DE|nr:KleE stable inheritance protein [Pseudomonas sp. CFBP 13602]MBD8828989.1 protein kleE [Pseudomonas sp. CFBP 13602]
MANNVFKFPGGQVAREALKSPPADAAPKKPQDSPGVAKKMSSGIVKVLWLATALVWPVLRWLLALDVAFQFALMVWHWDNPASHAGWTFALHFAVMVALTFFVSVFKPKDVK